MESCDEHTGSKYKYLPLNSKKLYIPRKNPLNLVCRFQKKQADYGLIHTGRQQMGPVFVNGSVHTARKQHQRENVPICMHVDRVSCVN